MNKRDKFLRDAQEKYGSILQAEMQKINDFLDTEDFLEMMAGLGVVEYPVDKNVPMDLLKRGFVDSCTYEGYKIQILEDSRLINFFIR